jgi:hypothetical protein
MIDYFIAFRGKGIKYEKYIINFKNDEYIIQEKDILLKK